MLSKPLIFTVTAILGLTSIPATATPLPNGTKLGITPGVGSGFAVPCATGSCFGMEAVPTLFFWTDLYPGTDGGLIVGQDQKSGGQELAPSADNNTSGELTAAWSYGSVYGTFTTTPGGGAQNIFDSFPCVMEACIDKTDLKVINGAWNGHLIPLGSAAKHCSFPSGDCVEPPRSLKSVQNYQIEPTTGGNWSMHYNTIVPNYSGGFEGSRFQMILRGTVTLPPPNARPTAGNINITGVYGTPIIWTPIVNDPEGDPITCRIPGSGPGPLNGVATIAPDCSGATYTADIGFIGIDSLTYIPSDAGGDGAPGIVTVAVTAPSPTPTPGCTTDYPISQISITGKRGHLTGTFTGNIVSSDNKHIKICPTTPLSYSASTNTPDASVVCRVKHNTTRGTGNLNINDHIKCTDKPVGNDKLQIKIKSGVKQRVGG